MYLQPSILPEQNISSFMLFPVQTIPIRAGTIFRLNLLPTFLKCNQFTGTLPPVFLKEQDSVKEEEPTKLSSISVIRKCQQACFLLFPALQKVHPIQSIKTKPVLGIIFPAALTKFTKELVDAFI